jgi:hypothetical protein
MTVRCIPCDQAFGSKEALQQHKRTSDLHAFNCTTCDRRFGSREALEQHVQNSPVHAPSFGCLECSRSFGSEEALEQHVQNSPVHAPSFDCLECSRSFGGEEALEQHTRDSHSHQQDTETPLDAFFRSFPSFSYDPSLPPATSFAKLQKHEGWRRGNAESKDAWAEYQDALESELHMWYGAEDDLTAWHSLCRAIGVEPLPRTCAACERVRGCVMKLGRLILTRITGCTKDTCQYRRLD